MLEDDDAEPLLGVTVLESLGIEIDARNEQLTKLPFTRMKTVLPSAS
jgi:predicted aspartyl protease